MTHTKPNNTKGLLLGFSNPRQNALVKLSGAYQSHAHTNTASSIQPMPPSLSLNTSSLQHRVDVDMSRRDGRVDCLLDLHDGSVQCDVTHRSIISPRSFQFRSVSPLFHLPPQSGHNHSTIRSSLGSEIPMRREKCVLSP